MLRHCIASSLRHCVASSLRHYVASSLQHFIASSLQHFVASSLCLQLLGSLIHLSQFYFMAVTSPLHEVSIICTWHHKALYLRLLWSCPLCVALFLESFFFFYFFFFFFFFISQVYTRSSSSSWFFVSSLIMVIFVDSSKTPKNQFITILSHVDEPIEVGITLVVFPYAGIIYSSSPIDVNRTPHLSHWWSESSRELYDPSKRDSHPV